MLCCAAVGVLLGNELTLGMSKPSVVEGFEELLAVMSKIAFGFVVPTPTCELNCNVEKRTVTKKASRFILLLVN